MYKIKKDALYNEEGVPLRNRRELLGALRYETEIESGVTLKDLFEIFEPIGDFISDYAMIDFQIYKAELLKPVDWFKKEKCPIDCIEIYWGCEYFEKYNLFGISSSCHGVDSSVPKEDHGKYLGPADGPWVDKYASRYWGISVQPVSQMASLPVVLNEDFDIEKLEDASIIQRGKRRFSLLEILDAVFYEISFHGNPDSRDDFMESLSEMVEEIKGMSPEEKKLRIRPIEDLFKELGQDEKEGQS